ncbi:MAG: START domain-containing protein [Candidatus Scalindua sp.]
MRQRFFQKKLVFPPFLSFITALLTAVFILALTPLKAGEEEWRFVYEADGITVHKRIKEDSIFLEFKSSGVLFGEISDYLSVILDTEIMPDWAPQCLEALNVESISDRETIIYVACNGVWPMADRDYVAKRTITSGPEKSTIRVSINLIENPGAPEIKSRVHIPYLQCCWILKRINPLHTHVELCACVDPGGRLPAWLVNWGYRWIAYRYLKDLESKVVERLHTATELASVSLSPLPQTH